MSGLCVALFAASAVAIIGSGGEWWRPGFSGAGVICAAFTLWTRSRVRTVIGDGRITVCRGLGVQSAPLEDVVEVVHRTSWSPVSVRLRSGEDWELPGVRPEDADEVRRLVA